MSYFKASRLHNFHERALVRGNTVLPTILRSKGYQTMKSGQLIEYNIRHILLAKSFPKCVGEFIPRSFSQKSKQNTSLDQKSKVLCSLFLLHAKLRGIEIYWNLSADHLLSRHMKLSYKTRWGLELVSQLIFCLNCKDKYFSCNILLTDQISLSGCLYFMRC